MFDVPVLEVTVSSAPVLINGVSQANQLSLYQSHASSAFLNALASLSPSSDDQADAELETSTDFTQTKTLLPQGVFQLLEPLNLSDIAIPENIFTEPLGSIPSQLTDSNTVAGADASTVKQQASEGKPSELVNQALSTQTTATDIQKVPPLAPRNELSQCIDMPYDSAMQGVTTLQILLQGSVIGELSSVDGTEQVISSLKAMLVDEQIDPDAIAPILGGEQPAIRINDDVLVRVLHQEMNETTPPVETQTSLGGEWAAIAWSDQLRQQLGATPLDPGNVQVMLKNLQPSEQQLDGTASWYGPYFHGRLTANGETFNQNHLTAAHKSLPFNTVLQVRNLKNNQTVVVRINDRGPYIGKRSLDLSKAAAQCLGSETAGVIPYAAVILEPGSEAAENSD
ncbi:MAG: septal ring lytic transglycosylase RlpA family protein [Cyanobacteria bacterium P01_H01_bin.21]